MSAVEFLAALAREARAVIAGPGISDSNRVRRSSEGGHVPDPIADELARPNCVCGSERVPRVSIRSQDRGTYWLGCLDCACAVLLEREDVSGWVVG